MRLRIVCGARVDMQPCMSLCLSIRTTFEAGTLVTSIPKQRLLFEHIGGNVAQPKHYCSSPHIPCVNNSYLEAYSLNSLCPAFSRSYTKRIGSV